MQLPPQHIASAGKVMGLVRGQGRGAAAGRWGRGAAHGNGEEGSGGGGDDVK